MPRSPHTSPQTIAVLDALVARPRAWQYGLELAQQTGLRSGTLYPLLIRLADEGFLEAKWVVSEFPGRPPRHQYRLTAAGRALARERAAKLSPSERTPARRAT